LARPKFLVDLALSTNYDFAMSTKTLKKTKGAVALRRRRISRGLTQSHVAKLVGRSVAQVSLWEAGRHVPAAAILAALERTLGVRANLWGQPAREGA
jgi:DNA-binding transcriptional regulator YiaG